MKSAAPARRHEGKSNEKIADLPAWSRPPRSFRPRSPPRPRSCIRTATASASQVSAFAGARFRVPLGGREKPRAGLALTSTLRSGPTGELRFARGAELGFSGTDSKLDLSVAGRPVSQLAAGRPGPSGRRQGFSTAGWIAIGASAAIIVGGILIFDYIGDQSE